MLILKPRSSPPPGRVALPFAQSPSIKLPPRLVPSLSPSAVLSATLSDCYCACHASNAVFLMLPGCLTCHAYLACCSACHRDSCARHEVLACLACRRAAGASRLSHSLRACHHRAGPAGCRACQCVTLIALPPYASRLPRLPTHFAAALVALAAAFVSLSAALAAALVAQPPHESR